MQYVFLHKSQEEWSVDVSIVAGTDMGKDWRIIFSWALQIRDRGRMVEFWNGKG
jgi:hypothetical protein